jgi:hypothetical protein
MGTEVLDLDHSIGLLCPCGIVKLSLARDPEREDPPYQAISENSGSKGNSCRLTF